LFFTPRPVYPGVGFFTMPPNFKKFSLIILCALGFIIYSNSLGNSFHFDDQLSIVSNLSLRDIAYPKGIWDFWPSRFITYFSFALNYSLHQLNVFGYHLTNLAIHLGAGLLVFQFALLVFSGPQAQLLAFFAAAIFLAHPLQTQAVTYIVQRAASLAALFYLASLVLYVKSRLSGNKRYYLGSVLAALAAVFSKEMAFSLPLIILLYEFYFFKDRSRKQWKRIILFLIIPLIIPLILLITKSFSFTQMRLISESGPDMPAWKYLFTQFKVIVTYLRLLFLPLGQSLDYDYPLARSFWQLPVLASFLFLAAIIFSAFRLSAKYKIVSFSIFWFFITLLPESSIIPIRDVIFEHRLYLPMVGFSFFAVSLFWHVLSGKNAKFIIPGLLILIIFYSSLTYARNYVWRDDFTLWDEVILRFPRRARAYNERGCAYKNIGKLKEAIRDYSRAIEIDPKYANAYSNRGNTYLKQGMFKESLVDLDQAIRLNPKSHFYYYNRGNIYKAKGEFDNAISDYTQALKFNPRFALAFHNRGAVYYEKKDFPAAISDYSKALEITPNLALTYCNRSNAYRAQGDLVAAAVDCDKAAQIDSGLSSVCRPEAK
jgi:tetratricopeptide (TPR) repeat protein